MDTGTPQSIERARFDVRGRVQGVGFRPFVYRVATDLGLVGTVGNDVHGAFIEVEGPGASIDVFAGRLQAELPHLARIKELVRCPRAPLGEMVFRIEPSRAAGRQDAEVSPDVGTCADCLRELHDASDRRHGYPFINCTNCGPRYSIVQGVPYDRVSTTMSRFSMCPECQREYAEPSDRRFHAQPDACSVCGPRVWFAERSGDPLAGDGVAHCAERLQRGSIVAIKGLGGFHLACRADRDESVRQLRDRKGRDAKPLALMVAALDMAEQSAHLDAAAAATLCSWRRPIVLVPKRSDACISASVAPGCDTFGLMLPYTPLHHLLFDHGLGPLVMTSGNPTEEPLCSENAEALERLAEIADGFLLHDRDIERPLDDSVVITVQVNDPRPNRIVPLRRSRGYVPEPIVVSLPADAPLLAVGGDLKSVVCLMRERQAVLSEHLGELSNPVAFRHFIRAIDRLKQLTRIEPELVASDLHPGYHSARHAATLGLPVTRVQHHHAHLVACMAEHGLTGEVLGLAADGTGYGTDGQVWGCELLRCDELSFQRLAHLRYFPLLGGDAAAVDTWRPAGALLRDTFGPEWRREVPFLQEAVGASPLSLLDARLAQGERRTLSSSLGRLFDAAACILGICVRNRFEAEAAMALEAAGAAADSEIAGPQLRLTPADVASSPLLLDIRPLLRWLVKCRADGRDVRGVARGFHRALAQLFAQALSTTSREEGIRTVVLSGGCFLNKLLTQMLFEELAQAGLELYIHETVPPGDGGLALGQAVVAAARYAKGQF